MQKVIASIIVFLGLANHTEVLALGNYLVYFIGYVLGRFSSTSQRIALIIENLIEGIRRGTSIQINNPIITIN